MARHEQQPTQQHEHETSPDHASIEQQERLKQHHERAVEQLEESPESEAEARHEALEQAQQHEHESAPTEEAAREKQHRPLGKKHRDANFQRTMTAVQSELSGPSRTFSKVIHHKAVEKTSDAVGNTIARPNAILAGSVAAFICTLAIYLIAKRYGYELSGFETIGAFIGGWLLGILFDFFRVMVTGRQ